MALTLTKVFATPNALRYLLSTDGGGTGSATKTAAELIADCADGPLKKFLSQTNNNNASTWEAALEAAPEVSFLGWLRSEPAAAQAWRADWGGSPNRLFFTLTGTNERAYVELRFWQSPNR